MKVKFVVDIAEPSCDPPIMSIYPFPCGWSPPSGFHRFIIEADLPVVETERIQGTVLRTGEGMRDETP